MASENSPKRARTIPRTAPAIKKSGIDLQGTLQLCVCFVPAPLVIEKKSIAVIDGRHQWIDRATFSGLFRCLVDPTAGGQRLRIGVARNGGLGIQFERSFSVPKSFGEVEITEHLGETQGRVRFRQRLIQLNRSAGTCFSFAKRLSYINSDPQPSTSCTQSPCTHKPLRTADRCRWSAGKARCRAAVLPESTGSLDRCHSGTVHPPRLRTGAGEGLAVALLLPAR